ncbi:MAG: DASH family cryptochrome [Bacteroidota bacterium]
MKRALVWFRNDLRLRDNETLIQAIQFRPEVVPVYILDQRYLDRDRWGFVRTGPYRVQFLLESLADLKEHLQEKNSDLLIKIGVPEELLPKLAKQYECDVVFASKEYTHEEIKIEKRLNQSIDTQYFHTSSLVHPDDVPFSVEKTPEVFTKFRGKIEKYSEIRPALEIPNHIGTPVLEETNVPTFTDLNILPPQKDERMAISFKGGAMEGMKRLDHYFWDTDAVATYKETRNGLTGADYSTKFSAWLANGSLSARFVYQELEAYEEEVVSNKSTYWVKFELFWRDYFKFVAMKHGRKIFFPGGIQGKSIQWRNNHKLFRKWATGNTGDDFVDANMRELLLTGFMSNRGRQNVASYLVHRLKQDWRMGAAWFESLLIDYDVCSNYGNWMYASGVGNDPRDRIFNTRKQANDYDGKGEYRSLWLAEPAYEGIELLEDHLLG